MQVRLSARNDRSTESAPRRHSFEGSEAFAALGSLATCGVMSRILTLDGSIFPDSLAQEQWTWCLQDAYC